MSISSSFGEFYVFFKKVINAPVIERRFDFCSDISFLCENNVFQHVEITFIEKGEYVTYLASTVKEDGIIKLYYRDREYKSIGNEGYWVSYAIKVPKHELDLIKQYCESCLEESAYDFSSLHFAWCQPLAFMMKRPNTHSCTSLTFNALLQSPSLKQLLLHHVFNNNMLEMIKQSHSPDPNVIYRMFKTMIRKADDDEFNGFYPISKQKMKYEYDFSELRNDSKICIKSSDAYFITSPESEEDCE